MNLMPTALGETRILHLRIFATFFFLFTVAMIVVEPTANAFTVIFFFNAVFGSMKATDGLEEENETFCRFFKLYMRS